MEASHPDVRIDSLSLTEYTYERWLMQKKEKEKKKEKKEKKKKDKRFSYTVVEKVCSVCSLI